MYRSMLVAIDGSGNANKALEVALQLARGSGAKLYLIHVPSHLPAEDALGRQTGASSINETPESFREAGLQIVNTAIGTLDLAGIVTETLIVDGKPAEAILDQARRHDVDAIVMGHRGLGHVAEMMGGSVSRYVNHHAACRVITVS
ncbi:universal stress protein [Kushneria aurantia]|uniref:Universal stress protein n=1 Tax=Kushneria aurantia TaxID=504092 RepID=A0ABV6G950_9GAMM|nr:universal stress protein [Kushneria aurantia]